MKTLLSLKRLSYFLTDFFTFCRVYHENDAGGRTGGHYSNIGESKLTIFSDFMSFLQNFQVSMYLADYFTSFQANKVRFK